MYSIAAETRSLRMRSSAEPRTTRSSCVEDKQHTKWMKSNKTNDKNTGENANMVIVRWNTTKVKKLFNFMGNVKSKSEL